MSGTGRIVTICPGDYDAVLFDLDGVLTRTATVHAAAWKRLFDDFLKQRAAESGEEFIPFDIDSDYLRYVDGKPRFDGVASFLESRGLSLPLGEPGDGPDAGTVHALGNLKDRYFTEYLKEHGVEPYQASIALVRSLRSEDIRTAVVSSSNNCEAVLDAVGIAQLFDTRVDGIDITRLGLEGKPAPDAFLEAARRLRADPARSGRRGGPGCAVSGSA
jgi:beta-phosphoglucomutase-like phosphatase (HAD superfamily)